MRRFTVAAAVVAVVFAMVACSGAVGARVAVTWPTAAPLSGVVPVGYWECASLFNPEDYRTTNSRSAASLSRDCDGSSAPSYTNAPLPDPIEYRADGTGYDLSAHAEGSGRIPESAFRISGSETIYNRSSELRWTIDGSTLTIQRRAERAFELTSLSVDVIRADGPGVYEMLMFRIGSPAYKRMEGFRECVAGNRGKALFEIKDCGNPLP